MQKYINSVAGPSGRPVSGASVQVNVYGGGAATIYSDNGVTPKTNPVVTDANGNFDFYAADGRYTLVISGASITPLTINDVLLEDPADTTGQLKFPATQNPSADPNTLDDYEEGTWTPTLTFVAPGDLAATYLTQLGRYTKIGSRVFLDCLVWAGTFTYTTASGNLRVAGIPAGLEPNTLQQEIGPCTVTGLSKAGFNSFVAEIYNTRNFVEIIGVAANGASRSNVAGADAPSGSGKWVQFSMSYTRT